MNNLRIDSHKLIYHVSRVKEWLDGKNVFPIYIEIGLSSACNHRCKFCALDFLNYNPSFIDTKVIKSALKEMAEYGVKSVMFAGEGEPLMHKDFKSIVLHAKKVGLDVAITSNGVLFNKDLAKECIPHLTWIKFSIDAGTPKTYSILHGTKPEDFGKVISNIENAVAIRNKGKYPCKIGVQVLLLPQNANEILSLAALVKQKGADYFVVKPYSQHPQSINKFKIDYKKFKHLKSSIEKLNTQKFNVTYRDRTMAKLEQDVTYKQCLGIPFFTLIDAQGNIIPCNLYYGKEEYYYGNLYKNSFQEIWEGEQRKKVLAQIYQNCVTSCRQNCRIDEINRYLWQLKHPPEHVNFI